MRRTGYGAAAFARMVACAVRLQHSRFLVEWCALVSLAVELDSFGDEAGEDRGPVLAELPCLAGARPACTGRAVLACATGSASHRQVSFRKAGEVQRGVEV